MTILTKNFADLKATVEAHVKADAVTQGIYWTGERGCFIGCLAHGNDTFSNEERFGLPVMVQRIAENIFEALSPEDAKEFFAALPEAVEKDGKDLSLVGWAFLALELRCLPVSSPEIETVIAGLDLLAEGKEWSDARAAADAAAAYAAAYAAYAADAAYAAAYAAAADAAADAAYAAYAARAAAYARAANADARAAANAADACLRQRDLLLRLIKEA